MKFAREESFQKKHPYIGTEHILVGLILENSSIAAAVLRQAGVEIEKVRAEIKVDSVSGTTAPGTLPFTARAKQALESSVEEAANFRHNYIGTEHLLLGIINDNNNTAAKILMKLSIDPGAIRSETLELMGQSNAVPAEIEETATAANKNNKKTFAKKDKSALTQFGRDLTQLAYEDKLDPLIGREYEIERTLLILARRTKNNPALLGEPGVGKTAIVEGIARKIVEGKVPEAMKDHRLIALDLAALVAGTKYRGQFEERIKAVMQEAAKEPIILFIDEIHTLVGAGGAEGAIDAANVLKPALSRGEIRCIGATTLDEYRKTIEKDGALARRFQQIIVEPPTIDQSIRILRGIQSKYEKFHRVKYDDAAIIDAVNLSNRYISTRFLPDKAIDVIDEAGARVVLDSLKPRELHKLESEIEDKQREKDVAVAEQDFEKAADIKSKLDRLNEQMSTVLEKHKKQKKSLTVTCETVAQTISRMTGIPISDLTASEADRLLNLEKELNLTVIGQNKAKQGLARALRKARAGLKDPKRPIGSFLFLGPTGVGKTLLVKAMAKVLLGSENSLIQLDMSEYGEKFNVSRLVGSPPGYVAYEEGGQLTEAVRRKPYSIILFDEIEKAHPDVFNILLQIMEEGILTDASGRQVDFRNTVVVLTSNVGSSAIQNKTSLGFGAAVATADDIIEKQLNDELSQVFKPEFLNRLNDRIIFTQLTREELYQVLDLELSKLRQLLDARECKLQLTQAAKDFLLDKGWNPEMGARPLKRALDQYLEDLLSEEILKYQQTSITFCIDYHEGDDKLSCTSVLS